MTSTPDSEHPDQPAQSVPPQPPQQAQPSQQAQTAAPTESVPTVPLPEGVPLAPPMAEWQAPDPQSGPAAQPVSSVPGAPAAQFAPAGPRAYAAGTEAGLPAPAYAGGAGLPPQPPVVPGPDALNEPAPAPAGAHPKSRSGALVAGIAIGALLGGLVGGGTAALVGANLPRQSVVASEGSTGAITLNNLDDVSTVSAVAAVAMPSVVTLEVTGSQAAGSGSGVIYSEDGYIVTNRHVATLDGAVGPEAQIRVRLSDGRVLDGTLVGTDPFSDLAVIKVEADDLTPISIGDSDKLNVGDLAVAIGAPLNLANTVTSGVVSALYRGISVGAANLPDGDDGSTDEGGDGDGGFPWDFRFGDPGDGSQSQAPTATTSVTLPVVQTDASINPGNSGGALLNANGELIGINVAIASNRSTSDSAGSDGLGFAIPSSLAVRVADAIISGEQPSHGLLGISVGDSSQDDDEDANRAGGLIMELTRGGAAEQAGLKVGDVITSVNGIPVDSGTTLSALIRMQEGGSEVTLGYTREGAPGEVTATLGTLEW